MRLSEAIRMNGMVKPQGFGPESFASDDAPCALGGALQSIGKQAVATGYNAVANLTNFGRVRDIWGWSDESGRCPVGGCGSLNQPVPLATVIAHLNDNHQWTRSEIADWVASVEPVEPEQVTEAVREELISA